MIWTGGGTDDNWSNPVTDKINFDRPPFNDARIRKAVRAGAKVFAIGMNYREHAKEAGLDIPTTPVVFTKFPNCLAGPRADVILTSEYVDWEVELVAVIGRGGRHISAGRALEHVAGYTVLYEGDRPAQTILLCDTGDGKRTVAVGSDPALAAAAVSREIIGREVRIGSGEVHLAH